MTTPIEQQIVIAVSSRALFNLESEHHIFESRVSKPIAPGRLRHANEPLEPGTAFPFIQKLLRINTLFGDKQPFRVVVLSRQYSGNRATLLQLVPRLQPADHSRRLYVRAIHLPVPAGFRRFSFS